MNSVYFTITIIFPKQDDEVETTEFAVTENVKIDIKADPVKKKKPSISVTGIDENGERTDAVHKSDNKTSSGHKTLPDKPNDTIGDTVEENVKKNATESVEEVFLPAEG